MDHIYISNNISDDYDLSEPISYQLVEKLDDSLKRYNTRVIAIQNSQFFYFSKFRK
jgi:hypothetical protein